MSDGQVKAIVEAITHLAQVMADISLSISDISESIQKLEDLAAESQEG